MKKFLTVCLVIALCLSCMSITGIAANVLGNAIYTDVVTYINHYPIPSYNFNGTTLIAAEDLQNYGFDVFWNEYAWSLTISRNKDKNNIVPELTFKPLESQIGKKNITITTTNVRVFTGNYQYSSFGGLDGKTLINVEDLRCIDGVSVVWVPEVKAIKVWIDDGLEMRPVPLEVRRIDDNWVYYDSCVGLDTYGNWQWLDYPNIFILTFAETAGQNHNICTDCSGKLEITDVIDANGISRLKNKYENPIVYTTNGTIRHQYEYEKPTLVPYFYGYSDCILSHYLILRNNQLLPNTAQEHGGLIKFRYTCEHGSSWNETIRVDCLPYE